MSCLNTSYQCQGRTPPSQKVVKIITMSTTKMPTAFWYWSPEYKHNTVKCWIEQCFTYIKKRQQNQLQQQALVPPCNHSKVLGLHTPDKAVGLARCHMMHTLKQKKGVTLSLKQEKISPHKVISIAQPVRASYLLVRKCSRSKALSGQAQGGVAAFPTMDLNVKHKTTHCF